MPKAKLPPRGRLAQSVKAEEAKQAEHWVQQQQKQVEEALERRRRSKRAAEEKGAATGGGDPLETANGGNPEGPSTLRTFSKTNRQAATLRFAPEEPPPMFGRPFPEGNQSGRLLVSSGSGDEGDEGLVLRDLGDRFHRAMQEAGVSKADLAALFLPLGLDEDTSIFIDEVQKVCVEDLHVVLTPLERKTIQDTFADRRRETPGLVSIPRFLRALGLWASSQQQLEDQVEEQENWPPVTTGPRRTQQGTKADPLDYEPAAPLHRPASPPPTRASAGPFTADLTADDKERKRTRFLDSQGPPTRSARVSGSQQGSRDNKWGGSRETSSRRGKLLAPGDGGDERNIEQAIYNSSKFTRREADPAGGDRVSMEMELLEGPAMGPDLEGLPAATRKAVERYWREFEPEFKEEEDLNYAQTLAKQAVERELRIEGEHGEGAERLWVAAEEHAQEEERMWEAHFDLLQRYRRDNGDCEVPPRYVCPRSGVRLGDWVRRQRVLLRKDGLPRSAGEDKGRWRRLDELGFNWDPLPAELARLGGWEAQDPLREERGQGLAGVVGGHEAAFAAAVLAGGGGAYRRLEEAMAHFLEPGGSGELFLSPVDLAHCMSRARIDMTDAALADVVLGLGLDKRGRVDGAELLQLAQDVLAAESTNYASMAAREVNTLPRRRPAQEWWARRSLGRDQEQFDEANRVAGGPGTRKRRPGPGGWEKLVDQYPFGMDSHLDADLVDGGAPWLDAWQTPPSKETIESALESTEEGLGLVPWLPRDRAEAADQLLHGFVDLTDPRDGFSCILPARTLPLHLFAIALDRMGVGLTRPEASALGFAFRHEGSAPAFRHITRKECVPGALVLVKPGLRAGDSLLPGSILERMNDTEAVVLLVDGRVAEVDRRLITLQRHSHTQPLVDYHAFVRWVLRTVPVFDGELFDEEDEEGGDGEDSEEEDRHRRRGKWWEQVESIARRLATAAQGRQGNTFVDDLRHRLLRFEDKKSGFIAMGDLADSLDQVGVPLSSREADMLGDALGVDRAGLVQYEQVLDFLTREERRWMDKVRAVAVKIIKAMGRTAAERHQWLSSLRRRFHGFDRFKDGFIAAKELIAVLRSHGVHLGDDEAARLLDALEDENRLPGVPREDGAAGQIRYSALVDFCASHASKTVDVWADDEDEDAEDDVPRRPRLRVNEGSALQGGSGGEHTVEEFQRILWRETQGGKIAVTRQRFEKWFGDRHNRVSAQKFAKGVKQIPGAESLKGSEQEEIFQKLCGANDLGRGFDYPSFLKFLHEAGRKRRSSSDQRPRSRKLADRDEDIANRLAKFLRGHSAPGRLVETLRSAFERADSRNEGKLGLRAFERLLESTGFMSQSRDWGREDIARLASALDEDGDGRIAYGELLKFMLHHAEKRKGRALQTLHGIHQQLHRLPLEQREATLQRLGDMLDSVDSNRSGRVLARDLQRILELNHLSMTPAQAKECAEELDGAGDGKIAWATFLNEIERMGGTRTTRTGYGRSSRSATGHPNYSSTSRDRSESLRHFVRRSLSESGVRSRKEITKILNEASSARRGEMSAQDLWVTLEGAVPRLRLSSSQKRQVLQSIDGYEPGNAVRIEDFVDYLLSAV